MKHYFYKKPLTILVFLIVVFAIAATTIGIFPNEGRGQFPYTSIRGETVMIYGKGLYKDMSAEVAPQGIAQDHVTLFIAIPLLIISFLKARQGSLKGRYLFAGTLGYFLVTYLFYTVMAMYNAIFLVYIILMGASFYSFILIILSFDTTDLQNSFRPSTPVKVTGGFLVFTSLVIGFLWLSIVVPPLLDGTIIPLQLEHYTTLIVQGLDLGILLPASFISGVLLIRKNPFGYLFAPVYFVFLSLLMTALSAKIIAMKVLGHNVITAIFIIPAFNIIAIICTIIILKSIKDRS
jgi:hypothetical protein